MCKSTAACPLGNILDFVSNFTENKQKWSIIDAIFLDDFLNIQRANREKKLGL